MSNLNKNFNINKIFSYIKSDVKKSIKQLFFLKKYLNHLNLKNFKNNFDFYVLSLNNSMFLLDKKDKDTYFREFKNKKKFDYYNSTFDERAKF